MVVNPLQQHGRLAQGAGGDSPDFIPLGPDTSSNRLHQSARCGRKVVTLQHPSRRGSAVGWEAFRFPFFRRAAPAGWPVLSPFPEAATEGRAAVRATPVVEDRGLALSHFEGTLRLAAHDDHKIGILASLDARALV